jgi:hypothetical protein
VHPPGEDAAQRALADLGLTTTPRWGHAPPMLGADTTLGLELLLLDAGLLLTLCVVWRVAGRGAAPAASAAVVATAFWAGGVWILCQPMAMRGMMVH